MGTTLLSFKGEMWRGRTTLATNDRGDRRMVRIINGYVSMDGQEIRNFPGWRCLLDLSEENNPDGGYSRYIIDALRPVMVQPGATDFYTTEYDGTTSAKQTLYTRAKPVYLEWFEQVGDVLTIGGITRFRENPIYSSGRVALTVVDVSTAGGGGSVRITMSATIGSRTISDATGASLNGLAINDIVYLEDIEVTSGDATLQAAIDASVNGRAHKVTALGGAVFDIETNIGSLNGDADIAVSGQAHVVRPNRNEVYGTPSGADPYDTNPETRIDDWNALTTWRIVPDVALTFGNAFAHTCHPAFVGNRRRDFGDEASTSIVEGVLAGPGRGVSRREQRELPYRMVPEPAGDRIIIAVPGYNCLFQVPLMIPMNPSNWPLTPAEDGLGVQWFGNDQFDQPRSLGLPKCRLVESPFTPAPSSPGESHQTIDVNHMLTAISASPQFSFPAGTYRLVATYADSVTGEEGEPSEVVEFTVPLASDFAYAINLTYMHPGYIMPECVADRINVYMTDTDGEAFGLYKSLPLRHLTGSFDYLGFALEQSGSFSPSDISSKYGMDAGFSPDQILLAREWNTLRLPLARGEPGDSIDFFRPPVNIGMPRGASVARFIRGVLLTGGHLGTEGPSGNLYPAVGSLLYSDGGTFGENDQIIQRGHMGSDFLNPEDGEITDGFGVASRNFPDACQGITGLSKNLIPHNMGRDFQVDKVLNRRSTMRTSTAEQYDYLTFERLKTVKPVVDQDFRETPMATTAPDYSVGPRDFWWRMLKGQIQVGEPGLPWRVTKAGGLGIQFVDYNRDDDIVGIWSLAGNAIICSRYETHFLSWSTSPLGQTPTVVHSDYGCIAPNSMVEFDGGVAWISERGPVALGAGLQFVGQDITEDFIGSYRRYRTDSRGMMRHTWGAHDKARGIVMWGMVIGAPVIDDGRGGTTSFIDDTTDGIRSRTPCDEILIWSYRTNSFSTWVPPPGLEVLWMRPLAIRDADQPGTGTQAMCFLAADGRIYTLDDMFSDGNDACLTTTAPEAGTSSLTLQTASTSWKLDGDSGIDTAFRLRVGQIVQAFDENDALLWETRVASANSTTHTLTLETAQTWAKNQVIRIGSRPDLLIETTALGAEFLKNGNVKASQIRYNLVSGVSGGKANAKVELLKSDLDTTTAADEISGRTEWETLGEATFANRHARRRAFPTDVVGPEIAMRISIASEPAIRIADLALELS